MRESLAKERENEERSREGKCNENVRWDCWERKLTERNVRERMRN